MGVYIKGMEMPKDYSVIVKIFPDGRVGTIPYVQWFKVELIEGVQAVPVPPHGKLGDLDALINKIGENVDKAKDRSYDWWYACTVAYDFALAAPTIIPAEEGNSNVE